MKSLLAPFALALLAGCSSSDPSPPQAPRSNGEAPKPVDQPAETITEGKATPTACRYIVPKSVEGTTVKCYDVAVLENRSKKDSRTIKIHVAVFPGKKELPPTFELIGGPGGGGDPMVGYLAANEAKESEDYGFLRERGDFVVFDQRGVGRSEPNLSCATEMATASMDSSFKGIMTKCRDRLVGESVDLGAYTTMDNALDVDDIRKALGYSKIDLHSISYGTLLALEVMRHRPDAVHSVIVDGVVPPEALLISDTPRTIDENLTRIFEACAAQPACKTAFPDLEGSFAALQQKLATKPLEAEGDFMDEYSFNGMLGQSMYSPDGVKRIPLWVHDFNARGDAAFADFIKEERAAYSTPPSSSSNPLVAEVDAALEKAYSSPDAEKYLGMNDGMYTSVTCSDSGQYEDPAAAEQALKKLRPAFQEVEAVREQFEICNLWPKSEKRPTTKQPVTSDIPTLSLGGEFDPVTPSYWAEQVTKTLSKSQFVLEKALAHGSMDACARQQKTAFLNDPLAKVDTTCSSERSLTFTTSFEQGSQFRSMKHFTARPMPSTVSISVRPNVIVRPVRAR
jgi:pimeloyl-ACP methyl ester carboxylesterase